MKIVILDSYTTNPGDLSWAEMKNIGDVSAFDWTDNEDVVKRLEKADVVLTNKVRLDADTLKKLPDLKYIGIMATGFDCVDINACKSLGIVVTNIPVYADYSVSQLVFALILELCYKIDMHSRSVVDEKYWSNQKYNSYWLKPLIGLRNKSLGIIGMGRIGERVANIGNAFGMKIFAYDVVNKEVPNVTWMSFEDVLRKCDVITLHCPLLPATRGLINKEAFKMMKSNAFFINTSRGSLMVDKDLAEALNSGKIAGAGLDVLGSEPPSLDNPLFTAKNVVITPHIGWATVDAREKLISETVKNLKEFLGGQKRNVVSNGG